MSDIPDALGSTIEGGMLARSVENQAGETSGGTSDSLGHTRESACLNCGTPLAGPHCSNCGQKAHVHRTLRAFGHDLVHGVFHFDGKFWRTVPMLAWRPGKLIREYIDGKRASYISPIALFLFTVFITYALFSLSGGFGEIEPTVTPETKQQMEIGLTEMDKKIANLEEQRNAAIVAGEPFEKLDESLLQARSERLLMGNLVDAAVVGDSPVQVIATPDTGLPEQAEDAEESDPNTGDEAGQWLNGVWEDAKENPKLLLYKLQNNAYKLSWLLIPLSLPFMWLLFPFSRKFRMYDHTVFVTYSISFMTMLAVVLSIGLAKDWWPLVIAPMLYAPFHLYRSLRGAYGLSRFGATWRMLVLSLAIWFTMLIFTIIMVGIVVNG